MIQWNIIGSNKNINENSQQQPLPIITNENVESVIPIITNVLGNVNEIIKKNDEAVKKGVTLINEIISKNPELKGVLESILKNIL